MDKNTKQTCGPVENGLVFKLSGKVGRANFWCTFQRGVNRHNPELLDYWIDKRSKKGTRGKQYLQFYVH